MQKYQKYQFFELSVNLLQNSIFDCAFTFSKSSEIALQS